MKASIVKKTACRNRTNTALNKNNIIVTIRTKNPKDLPVFSATAASTAAAAAAAVAADFFRVSGDCGYAPFLFIVQHVI